MTATITDSSGSPQASLPQIILVVGPTASGKTALAVALASHTQGVIISADSRQCYREMPIGSAAPSPHEMQDIPHFFVGDRSVKQHFSAGQFEQEGLACIRSALSKGQQIIVCGGAGLFVRALVEGLDELGLAKQEIREYWQQRYRDAGITALQNEILDRDPAYAKLADMNNHQRLIRALEIMDSYGQKVSTLRTSQAKKRPFECLWIGLNPDRQNLHMNINHRVDSMVQLGLEREAAALFPWESVKACQSPGYVEWESYWNGEINHLTCIERIKQHTRQYARRQLTWFRRNPSIHWVPPEILETTTRLHWVLRNLPIQ